MPLSDWIIVDRPNIRKVIRHTREQSSVVCGILSYEIGLMRDMKLFISEPERLVVLLALQAVLEI
jgi:hypothetical protein